MQFTSSADTIKTNAAVARAFGRPVEEVFVIEGTPVDIATADQLISMAAFFVDGCDDVEEGIEKGAAIIGIESRFWKPRWNHEGEYGGPPPPPPTLRKAIGRGAVVSMLILFLALRLAAIL